MVVFTFHGALPEFHAVLTSTPEGATLTGTAPVGAVTTDQADLTAHLLSPEFFDAERHPTATFRSDRIVREGEDGVVVTGELTIKGITNAVELRGQIVGPITDPYGNERLGLELGHHRPLRLRHALEHAAPRRGPRRRQGGPPHGEPRAAERGVAMRILGISGSLRAGSYNTNLLRAAAEAAPAGVELVVWEGLREIPPYDADLDVEPAPEAVRRLREAIAGADAVLFATPEYNASVPGQLKNAIDWASRPFPESALPGKAGGRRGRRHGQLRRRLGAGRPAQDPRHRRRAGARGGGGGAKAAEAFDERGHLLSAETRAALHGLVTELMAEATPVPAAA